MFNRVRIKNLLRVDEADLELGDLTLLYGPNSGGKSSIMRGIELLIRSIFGPREEVNIGKFARKIPGDSVYMEVEGSSELFGEIALRSNIAFGWGKTPNPKSHIFEINDLKHGWDEKKGVFLESRERRDYRVVREKPPLLLGSDLYLLNDRYYYDLYSEYIPHENKKAVNKLVEIWRIESEKETAEFFPYIFFRRMSLGDIVESLNKRIRYLYSLGRGKIGDLVGDLNYVISDSFEVKDILPKIEDIYIKTDQDDLTFSLWTMSDGFLQTLNIISAIHQIDHLAKDVSKEIGSEFKGMLLVEVFDAGVHIDWLLYLLESILRNKPNVKIVAEVHTGLLLSYSVSRGYPAYYVKDGKTIRITKENLYNLDLLEREVDAYRKVFS